MTLLKVLLLNSTTFLLILNKNKYITCYSVTNYTDVS